MTTDDRVTTHHDHETTDDHRVTTDHATTDDHRVTIDHDHGSAALVCALSPADLVTRAARWEALTARALLQASRSDRGLRLVFRAGPRVAGELSALVALERECCAFAAWSVVETDGKLALDITGRGDQAVAAVQAMFSSLT